MKYTYETINVLMLLIPGLISIRILETIRRKEIESPFNKLVESLIFSFLIYISVSVVYKWGTKTDQNAGCKSPFTTANILFNL